MTKETKRQRDKETKGQGDKETNDKNYKKLQKITKNDKKDKNY